MHHFDAFDLPALAREEHDANAALLQRTREGPTACDMARANRSRGIAAKKNGRRHGSIVGCRLKWRRRLFGMFLTAHQPVYLPWLGLFHKAALADKFVSFDEVQYQPKGWNNRNRIKTPAGPTWLTVPVLRKGYLEKPIRAIEINNAEPWRRKHWRSLLANYGNATHFDDYAPFFEDLYAREWRYLAELNEHVFRWLLDTLDIEVGFMRASDLDFQGAKSALVLDMCKKLGANLYIFGALGSDYADAHAFEAADVEIVFQDYRHPTYPQLHGDFIPNLSIVDLLFNCGPRSHEILLSGQEAIDV
jgi:hypothetical protein